MEQLSFIPEPKLHRSYTEPMPQTSKEAFQSIDLAYEETAVLAWIREAGTNGRTADEVEVARGGGHQRICELRRRGLIVKAGIRRATRRGRSAEVWVAHG